MAPITISPEWITTWEESKRRSIDSEKECNGDVDNGRVKNNGWATQPVVEWLK